MSLGYMEQSGAIQSLWYAALKKFAAFSQDYCVSKQKLHNL